MTDQRPLLDTVDITVVAPCDLKGGTKLKTMHEGTDYLVEVPANGISEGESFNATGEVAPIYTRGESQAPQYRDSPFAVLFIAHLGALIFFAVKYIPAFLKEASETYSSQDNHDDYVNLTFEALSDKDKALMLALPTISGFVLSGLGLSVLIAFSKQFIHLSLMLGVAIPTVLFSFFLWGQQFPGAIFMGIFALMNAAYYYCLRNRIDFAAANLAVASSVVKSNLVGLLSTTLLFSIMSLIYGIVWSTTIAGYQYSNSSNEDGSSYESNPNKVVDIAMIFSIIWSLQVFGNLGAVTTAGTVGKWWFEAEGSDSRSGCCGDACDAAKRSMTTSFGSICFGSLLVAIIRTLEQIAESAKNDNDGEILLCLVSCILGCIGDILEYFNKWAYVYVGLYGYSYIDAGKNVVTLFKARGFSSVITDNLASRAISIFALVLSIVGGSFGLIYAKVSSVDLGLDPAGNAVVIFL